MREIGESMNRGFTLLQTCIIITVVGLMAAGALATFRHWIKSSYIDLTDNRQEQVVAAIEGFYTLNGAFPCPADPNLPPTSPNYGVSINVSLPTYPFGKCDTDTDAVVGGTQRSPGPAAGPTVVRIGAVPARTLGLPDDYMLDASQNKVIYVVTEALTKGANFQFDQTNPATMGQIKNGAVDIVSDINSADHILTSSHIDTTPGSPCTPGPAIPASYFAPYALISQGRTHNPLTANELENTDGDNVFTGGHYTCVLDKNGHYLGAGTPGKEPRYSYMYRAHVGD
jgi:type II secretory pathway pseudopilin PulG